MITYIRPFQSSGCFGCDAKNKLIKSQESQHCHEAKDSKPCMAEDGGKHSRYDMSKNAFCSSHGTGDTSQGFTNHGLLLWNEGRQQWIGSKRKSKQTHQKSEPRLSSNATYDNLLGSSKPFAKPVPLSEMVNFLVNVWEKEGMYE